jgi:hypothetical protein
MPSMLGSQTLYSGRWRSSGVEPSGWQTPPPPPPVLPPRKVIVKTSAQSQLGALKLTCQSAPLCPQPL